MKFAVGVVLWAMAAFAACCSGSLFLAPVNETHVEPGRERARAAYPDIGGDRAARLMQSAKRWWHLAPVVVELAAAMLIIEFTCVVAAVSGGASAVNALRLG